MRKSGILDLVEEYLPAIQAQREHTAALNEWVEGKNGLPVLDEGRATEEYKQIREFSTTPWARLIVTGVAQALYVDGYRHGDDNSNSPVWDRLWQPNGMDSKQVRIHRAALGHGLCYGLSTPGTGPDGKPMAVMTGISAMRGAAFYRDDPLDTDGDEWPELFFMVDDVMHPNGGIEKRVVRMVDDERIYTVETNEDGDEFTYVTHEEHYSNTGAPPVVRFANMLDLDGYSLGEVEPIVPLLNRVDQDAMDRLVIQRNSAWQVRYATGLEKPRTDDQAAQAAAKMRVQDMLIAENKDARFGVLPPSPMGDLIAARDSDIRDLAAASQTPPHHLLGLSPNVGADGLVEAQRSLMSKIEERKATFGDSWEQWLRLGAAHSGMTREAMDYASEVRWRDTESRSLSQIADALGKLAVQLKVPAPMLWERLPNWTDQDTDRAMALTKELLDDEDMSWLLEKKDKGAGAGDAGSGNLPAAPTGGAAETTTEGSKGKLLGRQATASQTATGRRYGDDWDGDGKPG